MNSEAPRIGPGEIDQGLWPLIDSAVADLAKRLRLGAGSVTVERAVLTTWSDSGLGCPRPGMNYLQIPTDGAMIELSASGAAWRYHSGNGRPPFLCESPLRRRPEGE